MAVMLRQEQIQCIIVLERNLTIAQHEIDVSTQTGLLSRRTVMDFEYVNGFEMTILERVLETNHQTEQTFTAPVATWRNGDTLRLKIRQIEKCKLRRYILTYQRQ